MFTLPKKPKNEIGTRFLISLLVEIENKSQTLVYYFELEIHKTLSFDI